MMLEESERQILRWALDNAGSGERAAAVLGINEGFLYHRCRELGVTIPRKKRKKTSAVVVEEVSEASDGSDKDEDDYVLPK